MQVPDVTKFTWQLNVALLGAIFSSIALIYNDSYIYYGFVTFLFGVISHFIASWLDFYFSDSNNKSKRAFLFLCFQIPLIVLWLYGLFQLNSPSITVTLNTDSWSASVASLIIGGLIGFWTVVIVDKLKEPNIHFEVGSTDDDLNKNRRFIHIKVYNKSRKYKWSPLTTAVATSSKAIVKIDSKQFVGRWTSKSEPLVYTTNGVLLNPNEILVTPREDICPAPNFEEAVQVAIGMKYDTEQDFYGFNNNSYMYQPQLKNTNFQYGTGEWDGEITVMTLGNAYKKKFKIYNPTTKMGDFRLELLDK